MIDTRYFTPLDTLTSWQPTPTGIRAVVDDAILTIDVLTSTAFRIQIAYPGREVTASTYSVSADLTSYSASMTFEDSGRELIIRTQALRIEIGKSPFRINAHRADGSAILETQIDAALGSYARLNDGFVVSRQRDTSDVILGLGQKTGAMNRNGERYKLWNTDVLDPSSVQEQNGHRPSGDPKSDPRSPVYDPYYISIPFYQTLDVTGKAAGFFIDNAHAGHFEFDHEDETRIHFVGGQFIEYVFAGPSLADILREYTNLTGRISTPPIWALGYHHCRWHPYNQADVLAVADTYRKKGIPCDSFWLDIDHMEGYRVFTWNKKIFPDPPKMLADLSARKFRSVTIVDPGVKVDPGYSVYDSGLAANAFCLTEGGSVYQGQVWPGKTAFPDFASKAARAWWGDLNAKHVQSGLAGIWNDMNEPATGAIPSRPMRFEGGKYSHGTYHNAFALLMAMSTVEGLEKAMPDLRPFVLSRAGSAGIQRYAANWLGDNMSRWDHLQMSVPMSLGLGLSGQPFIGADIGGFGENSNPELLARWFQFATLTPFCRHHNDAGSIDQYPWSFGPEVEAIAHAALNLRYRLMPYLYSAFVHSSETGAPIMRPLVFDHQDQPALRQIDNEYVLGQSLLVAPITQAGQTNRKVTLPPGSWIDWHSHQTVTDDLIASAPLDRIPLFVQAGAVIPMWPEVPASTMGYHPETIELHVFLPERDGTYRSTLVEDDGETHAYRDGKRLTTTLSLTRIGQTLLLKGRTQGQTYAGFQRREFKIVIRGLPSIPPATVAALTEGFMWTTQLPAESGAEMTAAR